LSLRKTSYFYKSRKRKSLHAPRIIWSSG
jgi:hypothetical protein